MSLPLPVTYAPMEARSTDELPVGADWQYEPKWDGFRCLAFRDGERIDLRSKAGKPLARYFPELVAALRALPAKRFVLDGEIAIAVGKRLDFDQLLQRIHPAASRIEKLSGEIPAVLIVFDLLVDANGKKLANLTLAQRRPRLEAFAREQLGHADRIVLSPATTDLSRARAWLRAGRGSLDGLIGKRTDVPYASGERTAMIKFKHMRTADCVVGGFRYAEKERIVGSLLLGLFDEDGLLHHVGFTSSLVRSEREKLLPRLEKLVRAPGFTGDAPGGPSRWSTERTSEWSPLASKLVVEVQYDHFTGGRFRHGTTFLRWRPDKDPKQCTFEQIEAEGSSALSLLRGARQASGRHGGARRSPRAARAAPRPRARTARARR